jgi:hypothetical protein
MPNIRKSVRSRTVRDTPFEETGRDGEAGDANRWRHRPGAANEERNNQLPQASKHLHGPDPTPDIVPCVAQRLGHAPWRMIRMESGAGSKPLPA